MRGRLAGNSGQHSPYGSQPKSSHWLGVVAKTMPSLSAFPSEYHSLYFFLLAWLITWLESWRKKLCSFSKIIMMKQMFVGHRAYFLQYFVEGIKGIIQTSGLA